MQLIRCINAAAYVDRKVGNYAELLSVVDDKTFYISWLKDDALAYVMKADFIYISDEFLRELTKKEEQRSSWSNDSIISAPVALRNIQISSGYGYSDSYQLAIDFVGYEPMNPLEPSGLVVTDARVTVNSYDFSLTRDFYELLKMNGFLEIAIKKGRNC